MSANEGTVGNGHGGHPGLGARVDQMGESAQQLFTQAHSVAQELADAVDLKGRVERHPFRMVLVAAGVGYVLGGGLFTRLTARAVRIALRLAALPLVKDELMGLAEVAVDGLLPKAQAKPGSEPAS